MFVIKKSVLAVSCSLACLMVFAPANAGFLNDMYGDISANANVTGAKVYETQRAGVISGGGLVWKTPRRDFQPFGFTPPSLKVGCGGIDLFMGSFSMFSRAEFVQMLRAVGQNAAGLLFQMALESLSPELAAQIENFSKKIQEMNNHFGNSCEMAKSALGFTGLDKMAKEFGESARGWGVANGIFPDRAEAQADTQADGNAVYSNVQPTKASNGQVVWDKTMNVMWNIMNTGTFDQLSDLDKEVLQTMLGTVIVNWTSNADPDRVLQPTTLPPLAMEDLKKWIGSSQDATSTITMPVYVCDEPSACLAPTTQTTTFNGLASQVYASLDELRQAVIQRRAPQPLADGTNPVAIAGLTTVPVGTIINFVTTSQYQWLGDVVLQTYADAIAYDIVTRLMQNMIDEIEKAQANYKLGASESALQIVHLKDSLVTISKQLDDLQKGVSSKIQEQNATIKTTQQMEQLIYGNISKKVLGNIRFENPQ